MLFSTLVFFLVVGFLLYSSVRMAYYWICFQSPLFIRDFLNRKFILRKLQDKYQGPIKESRFYQGLNTEQKNYFERRVQRFIDSKEFIHRVRGKVVTDEMKVWIACTAIQLTYHHPSIYLDHFWRILIYDTDYYSRITKMYHQGEVNARGFIVLSWDNFMRGYDDSSDGVNLGFHEMAHALQVENIIENSEYDFLDRNLLESFRVEASKAIAETKIDGNQFFRKSAYFNRHEFFAVTVESFFERPSELEEHSKRLYSLTAGLLNYPTT